ncbi:MAG: adenylyltransferase/cytidyltransferase family protein [Bacteroidales bacterium]|jgi:riboflavin kinase/FMN adenylyltransferase|nr:adenylyltransferase/cytidyltransferase family protein [Bacteroidales bacterium]
MQIIRGIENIPILQNTVVTVGAFDGVHLGHLRILKEVKKQAAQTGGVSVVLTFDPHPQQVLFPDHKLVLINTIDEKIAFMENAGIDCLIIIPFTLQFSQLSAEQFIQNLIVTKIGAKVMVMGPDHAFGKGRQGNRINMLELGKKSGLKMVQVEELIIDNQTVSSTAIRHFIQNGETAKAEIMLGKRMEDKDNI